MSKKFKEDSDDVKARIFLDNGRRIMDSFNQGDYLTISGFNDEIGEWIGSEYIDIERVISNKRSNTWYDDINWEEREEIKVVIPRLYKVVNIAEGNIPIVVSVKFPGEVCVDTNEQSLLAWFYNYISELCDDMCYGVSPSIEIINKFAKLDSNYADSVILDSLYIPYEYDIEKVRELEAILDIRGKQFQKERIAKARKEKREENQMWKGEFLRVVGFGLRKKYGET